MTKKRFQWIYIKDSTLELRDNGIVKVFNNERLEELLNNLNDENEQLKSLKIENDELKREVTLLTEFFRKNNFVLDDFNDWLTKEKKYVRDI